MSYSGASSVAWAKTQVGFHEGPNNYNPYSRWQYGNPYNSWCASFASMAAYMGGYRFQGCSYGERGEAYVPNFQHHSQEQGGWRDRNWRASPGDIVMFDWEWNGELDHSAIVVYDDGRYLMTIGGNESDSVKFRTTDRSNVVGFWALSEDVQAKPVITPAVLKAIKKLLDWQSRVTAHPVEFGDTNSDSLILNTLLVSKGFMVVNHNTYNKATQSAVHNSKLRYMQQGLVKNSDGTKVGGDYARAILKPR